MEPLFARLWTNRREGVVVVAAQDARQTPEGIGSDSQLRTMTFSLVERQVVFITHARHDERTLRSESGMQRRDQADRPALDWFHFGECCVDEKYSARLYTKLEQLLDQGVPVDKVHWGKSSCRSGKEAGVLSFNKNGVAYATP